jgi:5-methyltetrahydrofolate--homocysteine methyltransferase
MTQQTATFVNIGERTNVTGSAQFKKLIMAATMPPPSKSRASRWRMARRSSTSTWTKGLLDAEYAMTTFLKLISAEPTSRGSPS